MCLLGVCAGSGGDSWVSIPGAFSVWSSNQTLQMEARGQTVGKQDVAVVTVVSRETRPTWFTLSTSVTYLSL